LHIIFIFSSVAPISVHAAFEKVSIKQKRMFKTSAISSIEPNEEEFLLMEMSNELKYIRALHWLAGTDSPHPTPIVVSSTPFLENSRTPYLSCDYYYYVETIDFRIRENIFKHQFLISPRNTITVRTNLAKKRSAQIAGNDLSGLQNSLLISEWRIATTAEIKYFIISLSCSVFQDETYSGSC
jgi:hypothetical protein